MYSKIVTLENVPVSAKVEFIVHKFGDPTDSDPDHEIIAIPADDPKPDQKFHAPVIQKLFGAAVIAISVIAGMLDGDGTVPILLVPLGLWMMFTKHDVLY